MADRTDPGPGTDDSTVDIAANLVAVQDSIKDAVAAAGREAGDVALVAVGKTFPAEIVERAILAGQRVFGENRVQEAMAKWPGLKASHPDVRLHLIGPLQTNKVRPALELFDVIETVDRPKLARALAREMDRTGRQIATFVQVNTGEEPQKAGVMPTEADQFIEACRSEFGLHVSGLMCIPPFDEPPGPHFALLADIAARHGLAELSMGMSADYQTAIRFGATLVRLGTAIFGPRGT